MFLFSTTLPFPDILFPFFAAALYCSSVMLVKYASHSGTLSGTSILVMNNILSGLVFIPAIFFEDTMPDWSIVWQPLTASCFCALGNIATFVCAERGEVSLMTPIMGIKIMFVILFARILLDANMPHTITLAGIICCIAVFIMGWSKGALNTKKLGITLMLSFVACISYAMCDVVMQKYAPNFTRNAMLSLTSIAMPLSIIPFLPRFFKDVSKSSKTTLVLGGMSAGLMIMEMYLMFLSIIGEVGAALCNILYNTRGILSVVLMFIVGKFVANMRELSNTSAIQRIIGATMILIAVSIVIFK